MRGDYKNTIQTVMANDAININKTSNHLIKPILFIKVDQLPCSFTIRNKLKLKHWWNVYILHKFRTRINSDGQQCH
jgi:hypothetical protein